MRGLLILGACAWATCWAFDLDGRVAVLLILYWFIGGAIGVNIGRDETKNARKGNRR